MTENAWRFRNNVAARQQGGPEVQRRGVAVEATITHSSFIKPLCKQLATVSELTKASGEKIKRSDRKISGRESPIAIAAASGGTASGRDDDPWDVMEGITNAEGVLCVGEDVENKSARCVWCTRVHDQQSRVSYRCKTCKEFFCRGAKSNKRQCFELHKIHGVPPRNCRDPKKCGDYEKWRDIAAKDTAALKRSKQSEGNKAAAKRLKKKKG